MMLNSFYSTVTLRQPAGHCHHTVISYFGWRLAGTYPVCVCVRLAWPRATSPSARVHESPQSRCCSSPGAQKHPQTLTRCNLHRGDKTTWIATLQPGGYVYIYIYILLSYTSQAASADSGWSRWVTCELQISVMCSHCALSFRRGWSCCVLIPPTVFCMIYKCLRSRCEVYKSCHGFAVRWWRVFLILIRIRNEFSRAYFWLDATVFPSLIPICAFSSPPCVRF